MQERIAARRRRPAKAAQPLLLIERPQPGVAVLTLNRPEARNSLSLGDDRRAACAPSTALGRRRQRRGDRARGQRPGVLAPATTSRSSPRIAPTPTAGCAFFDETMTRCSRHDAGDRRLPQAGHRRRAGHGDRRRLPARRHLRSGGRRRRRASSARRASTSGSSARRRWWRCRATCRASARWRCCSRRDAVGRGGRRLRPRQSRRAGRQRAGRGAGAGAPRSRRSRRRPSRSARPPSTRRSRCRSPRPTPMPPRSWSRT